MNAATDSASFACARPAPNPVDEAETARSWFVEQTGETPAVLRVSSEFVRRFGHYMGMGEADALVSIHHRRLQIRGMRVELVSDLPAGVDALAVRA